MSAADDIFYSVSVANHKIRKLRVQLAALTAERDRLAEALRAIQYSGDNWCQGCGARARRSCEPDCFVAAALASLPDKEPT